MHALVLQARGAVAFFVMHQTNINKPVQKAGLFVSIHYLLLDERLRYGGAMKSYGPGGSRLLRGSIRAISGVS